MFQTCFKYDKNTLSAAFQRKDVRIHLVSTTVELSFEGMGSFVDAIIVRARKLKLRPPERVSSSGIFASTASNVSHRRTYL